MQLTGSLPLRHDCRATLRFTVFGTDVIYKGYLQTTHGPDKQIECTINAMLYSVGNNGRKCTRLSVAVISGTRALRAGVTRLVHNASNGGSLAQPFA